MHIFYIYIPLCLYFNEVRITERKPYFAFTFHYVSILIRLRSSAINEAAEFTFHYVSILISSRMSPKNESDAFTFHYVSILICIFNIDECPNLYLHSIMSLF